MPSPPDAISHAPAIPSQERLGAKIRKIVYILRLWGTRPMVWTIREGATHVLPLRRAGGCKYPPAEPVALRLLASQRGLRLSAPCWQKPAAPRRQKPVAPRQQNSIAPRFSVGWGWRIQQQTQSPVGTAFMLLIFLPGEWNQTYPVRLPQMSNCYCHSGRAGGSPPL